MLVGAQLGFCVPVAGSSFPGIVSLAAVTEFLCAVGEFGAQGVLQRHILSVTSLSREWVLLS